MKQNVVSDRVLLGVRRLTASCSRMGHRARPRVHRPRENAMPWLV